ncbi:putative transmembrane protein [Toxoplasma gondii RUB]|uniref:Putative transmembrane protein n=1 Tax=Toxoplasma gondii RUB TaxID=935652 RepID=A0A086LZ64_TOXGO|nr:putative transmembrane protein [Toxoplasma gondii RUB]
MQLEKADFVPPLPPATSSRILSGTMFYRRAAMCKNLVGSVFALPPLLALLLAAWSPQHLPFTLAANGGSEPGTSDVLLDVSFAEVGNQWSSLISSGENGVSELSDDQSSRSQGRERLVGGTRLHHRTTEDEHQETAAGNSSVQTGQHRIFDSQISSGNTAEVVAEPPGSAWGTPLSERLDQADVSKDRTLSPHPSLSPFPARSQSRSLDETQEAPCGEKALQSAEALRRRAVFTARRKAQANGAEVPASARGLEERLQRRCVRDRRKALKVEARWKISLLFATLFLQVLDSYIFVYRDYYDQMTVARTGGTRTLGTLLFRFFHNRLVFYVFLAKNLMFFWDVISWLNEYPSFDYSAVLRFSHKHQPLAKRPGTPRKAVGSETKKDVT